jgi:hypothetical protein
MTTKFVRCRHCEIQYAYHPSGHAGPLNNDTYCPDCYELIIVLFKDVPKRKRRVWIAAQPMSSVMIEAFNETRKKDIFQLVHVLFSENIKVDSCSKINGEHYRLCTNKDDGSQLLEIECEEDVATGVITGTWNCAGFATLHKSEEGRKLSKDFWSKNRVQSFSGEVRPMDPPNGRVYYLKPVYKDLGDVPAKDIDTYIQENGFLFKDGKKSDDA